jgi:hypothetical protein
MAHRVICSLDHDVESRGAESLKRWQPDPPSATLLQNFKKSRNSASRFAMLSGSIVEMRSIALTGLSASEKDAALGGAGSCGAARTWTPHGRAALRTRDERARARRGCLYWVGWRTEAMRNTARLCTPQSGLHRRREILHSTPQVLIECRSIAARLIAQNGLGLSPVETEVVAAGFETAFPLVQDRPDNSIRLGRASWLASGFARARQPPCRPSRRSSTARW